MIPLYTEESEKETHSHLNYLLLLWRNSLRRQISLKESMSMEKTLHYYSYRFADDVALFNRKSKQMEKH